jgi:ABC-type transporter Mla MlaB component
MRAALLVDGIGAAREDDALGGELELRELLGAWQHLREDIELTETASDPSQTRSVDSSS